MNEEEKRLFINEKIKNIEVNGYGVELLLENNIKLIYDSTDGGYSTYEIIKKEEENNG